MNEEEEEEEAFRARFYSVFSPKCRNYVRLILQLALIIIELAESLSCKRAVITTAKYVFMPCRLCSTVRFKPRSFLPVMVWLPCDIFFTVRNRTVFTLYLKDLGQKKIGMFALTE